MNQDIIDAYQGFLNAGNFRECCMILMKYLDAELYTAWEQACRLETDCKMMSHAYNNLPITKFEYLSLYSRCNQLRAETQRYHAEKALELLKDATSNFV